MMDYCKFAKTAAALALAAILLSAGPGNALAPEVNGGVDPDSYPIMSKEEAGQLRYAIELAGRDLGDFTEMEGVDQYGMTAYRYLIAFTTYFMALEQYHKLPACPGPIKPRMDRFIQKILVKDVWEYWAHTSRGLPNLEPKMNKPYPEEHDPVGNRNIMYSGHVMHMIGLYEALYRDFKWSEPGSIVFEWSPDERYVYDNHSLNEAVFGQMVDKAPYCIECEPNACFPECNQHPILSFMLHDKLHGTDYYPRASERFMDFFLEKRMIHPESHQTAMVYLVKQDVTVSEETPRYKNALDLVVTPAVSLGAVSLESASADGWTGAFMHVWRPDYIERHYRYQKEYGLRDIGGDTARLDMTIWEPQLKYGFFAALAAEVGDYETRDRLVNFAHRKYEPLWEDGKLRYPYSNARGCTNLSGKLLALARANVKDGLRDMHADIFDEAHFDEPRVDSLDYPRALPLRAIYDREKSALVLTLEPGGDAIETSFKVVNLDPDRTWTLWRDGAIVLVHSGRAEMDVSISLEGRTDLVLVAE